MNFKDFFDLKEMTIGSLISWYENNEYGKDYGIVLNFGYHGGLEEDSFYLNSLLDSKGNNLYKDYVEENFFKKIEEIMHSKSLSRSIPPTYNLYEDKNGEKHLVYDLYVYLYSMLNGFYLTNVPKEFVEKNILKAIFQFQYLEIL